MDKLLPVIDWMKKNRFWLACGFLSVAMIGTWFFVTGQIQAETDKNAGEVKSSITSATNLTKVEAEEGTSAHPNASTEAGMKAEMEMALNSLVEAWEYREDKQKEILKWPTEIIGKDKFVEQFSKYNPPETIPLKLAPGHGLEPYLNLYRITIPRQMEKICKELGTRWNADPKYALKSSAPAGMSGRSGAGGRGGPPGGMSGMMGGGMMGGGGAGEAVVSDDLNKFPVIWNDENQALWLRKLTQFRQKDDHTLAVEDPTPLQVYMLQQDLWLLEAMFHIIKEVNGSVDANDLAVIKRIDHVAFGREARIQLGELQPYDPRLAGITLEVTAAASGMPDYGAGVFDRDDGPGGDGGEVDADGFDKTGSFSPYHGRYVDVNFVPLHADVVREILDGKVLPAENLELIVAKRVPVRIALRMNERNIPEFMTACANSPFAFEINQVRMNRHEPGEGIEFNGGGYGEDNAAGGAGAEGGGREGMMDGLAGIDMGARINEGGGEISNLTEVPTNVEIRTNYDVNVEFYGIVKIYNPVTADRIKLLREAAGLSEEIKPSDAAKKSTETNIGNSKP